MKDFKVDRLGLAKLMENSDVEELAEYIEQLVNYAYNEGYDDALNAL